MASPSPSAIADLVALILIFSTTVPTLLQFFSEARIKAKGNGYEDLHKLYEDRDGVATEESQNEYSATIPKYIALSSCILGFLVSIIIAVFTTIHPSKNFFVENWVIFGSWVWTK